MGAGGTVLGCLLGLFPAVSVLWTGQTRGFHRAWLIPFGAFSLQLDALSAIFLFTILILSAVAAVYGNTYLWDYRNRKNLGASWLFFNILVASMILVVISHNGMLFLMAWEIMSLASFFLVTFEDENESVRRAGWIYLVATHIGTAFLFVLFILLAHQGPSLDFNHFMASGLNGTSMAGLAFLLSVIGFGTKAGFMPFHVWLPEAHPAAPSHVSAVMSGVMIKTGIYGLLRALTFLGRPEPWWGWLLIAIGLGSGILGVLFALAQHDLKRLLAYHSVENIGIVTLGLALGVLGLALNQPALAVLGFGGGLLHVLNHALFKGLLFLGAGAVLHATGVRNIEQMGGLMRHMPWTGTLFLIGSFAICGLPPLNGFVSEFLIYVAAFMGTGLSGVSLSSIGVITGLAAIGGLAAACFTKAFGIVFLGEPRHTPALQRHEIGWGMRIPMLILALGCLSIGLLSPYIVSAMNPVIGNVTGLLHSDIEVHLSVVIRPLQRVTALTCIFILILGLLATLRRHLLSGRTPRESNTWDCGFVHPTARMQYTASSYAQPITAMFDFFLQTHRKVHAPEGLFPAEASLHTHTDDVFSQRLFEPLFRGIERLFLRLHWLQQGRVQIYILYVAVTILVLLIWNLR
ncbi:MAG: proton-conducting transporter membrane subunit [Deltaproteobacteria bacterium]|nr:proton-conducting transporter membrane subunit [Deltaproteobacteria bacterium]